MNFQNSVDPSSGKQNIFNMTLAQVLFKVFDVVHDLQPTKLG